MHPFRPTKPMIRICGIVGRNGCIALQGLDNTCHNLNSKVDLGATFHYELLNNNDTFDVSAVILKETPVDIMIDRETIKKHKLFVKYWWFKPRWLRSRRRYKSTSMSANRRFYETVSDSSNRDTDCTPTSSNFIFTDSYVTKQTVMKEVLRLSETVDLVVQIGYSTEMRKWNMTNLVEMTIKITGSRCS